MSFEGWETADRAVAIIGVGAVLPEAANAQQFWDNVVAARYLITDVPKERWDPADYYDPDPKAPGKTYSKIGGWVRNFSFDSLRYRIPPRVAAAMDESQMWAIAATREALTDAGHPDRPLNVDRTAVIVGNAMGGERHYHTVMTATAPPALRHALQGSPTLEGLQPAIRKAILDEAMAALQGTLPPITEDSMPGELANVVAGRIANVFDLHGPNYICDAACASSLAALDAAVEGLLAHHFDVAVCGGADRNMGPGTFVKFCKIGALSPDGSRPFAKGANGFVMGEGCAIYILKRLADAERDGDRIYAVIRSIGGSSDGKGKGITAPNPEGQKRAVSRAYQRAGFPLSTVQLIEAHGTSTTVGDLVEVSCLKELMRGTDLPVGSVALGSVKSQIGHLKAAAGAAGMLKAILALHHKVVPPTANYLEPNPDIRLDDCPLYVNTQAHPWERPSTGIRRAAVSAFGFGGTNFHVVLEEHIPGLLTSRRPTIQVPSGTPTAGKSDPPMLRGMVMVAGQTLGECRDQLVSLAQQAEAGHVPEKQLPEAQAMKAPERIAIDFGSAKELQERAKKAIESIDDDRPAAWRLARGKGVFRGHEAPGKVAFMFPGQGSQYVNMLRELRDVSETVREVFDEADEVMMPRLNGRKLTDLIYVDDSDPARKEDAERQLQHTTVTQPAMLAADIALARLLGDFGIEPDMVVGHSLGEYAALVVAGVLPFADALVAVSARAREMANVSLADSGKMAGVIGPYEKIEQVLKQVDGYVVAANRNSRKQTVIAGATAAVEQASEMLRDAGLRVVPLAVSHAFHSEIVAPASEPLRKVIQGLRVQSPRLPVIANVDGQFYPMGPNVTDQIIDRLARQIAAPVQFVSGLETLYREGVRVFVEVGPKKVLASFADECLSEMGDVVALATNNPKTGPEASFGAALAYLYSIGRGRPRRESTVAAPVTVAASEQAPVPVTTPAPQPCILPAPPDPGPAPQLAAPAPAPAASEGADRNDVYQRLGKLFADFLEQGMAVYRGSAPSASDVQAAGSAPSAQGSIVISGAGIGLPGKHHALFDDTSFERMLRGEVMIDPVSQEQRQLMVDKNVVRLIKSEHAGPSLDAIRDTSQVLKLAGQRGDFDMTRDFGIAPERVSALDITTQMAIGAGLEALRDAGIPLVQRYRKTSRGTFLPDRWMLPESMADETGVIFASAFPGYNRFADFMAEYQQHRARIERVHMLEALRATVSDPQAIGAIDAAIEQVKRELQDKPYLFSRKFLFEILAMGHSQFAELIGARGPNTQVNSACASTTLAVAMAEDWIRSGRCARVLVIAADDTTSDTMLQWIGAGFLATGAATTEDDVTKAALPFDRRRHGMIIGMGACALVIESEDMVRARGMRGIVELLATETANSAFHGTRLDVHHISGVLERMISLAEKRHGLDRKLMAPHTVFISHETYTPARGGSASAEVHALRQTFGDQASSIVIANTKGFTGHPMGVGLEDALAVRMLERRMVPPIPNFREVDPELGPLNLSRGGAYPIDYALRFSAGFGSQIAVSLMRRVCGPEERFVSRDVYVQWLRGVSGYAQPQTEVVHRTLRIRDEGVPSFETRPSSWQRGQVPQLRTEALSLISHAVVAAPSAGATVPTPALNRPALPTIPPPDSLAPLPRAPAPAPAAAPQQPDFAQQVLQIVADKTGYPMDMLALDLDLEADLGIDTVKQAEVLAAIRTQFNLPRRDDLKLRDYPTLAHVIGYVKSGRPDLAEASAAAAPAPVTTPASPAPQGADPVAQQVLQIVADKTGYPMDMLALDLDLEADLGIDTVKQAEVFAALRAQFDLPRRDDLKLRDYPTLAHVIGYVRQGRPDLAAVAAPAPAPVPAASPAPAPVAPSAPAAADPVASKVLQIVADKTGYPSDMLALDLDLEADLGIDTVKQAEVFAELRKQFDLPRRDDLKLRDYPTLEHVIGYVRKGRPDLAEPAPAPAQAPAQPANAEPTDDVKQAVLAIVADKTGYPADMLAPDLDLEADLGIDTVKQAEIFAAVRDQFGIARVQDLKLRDYPTLAHVVQFVRDHRTQAPVESHTPEAAPQTPAAMPRSSARRLVPLPMQRVPLSMCKASGCSITSASRIVVLSDGAGAGQSLAKLLEDRQAQVLVLARSEQPESLVKAIADWSASSPIDGVVILSALDDVQPLDEMAPEAFARALNETVRSAFNVCRAQLASLRRSGAFVVAATRLGGTLGYGATPAHAPLGGAISGFVKSLSHEIPECMCKVVDFEADAGGELIAKSVLEEIERDPGAVEIGYHEGQRMAVTLMESPQAEPQRTFGPDTVFVVTGAGGGITSAITADLARASGGVFYLLDLPPQPDRSNPDLKRIRTDREGLKRELMSRLRDSAERVTPAMVERELQRIEREAATLAAIESVEQAGGKVTYWSCSVLDYDTVERLVQDIGKRHGGIDVLVHAAGFERSRALENKEPAEFNLVFDVKAIGMHSLLRATRGMRVGTIVSFSSVAGRFGNAGQADYSAANDFLCKVTSSLGQQRPDTQGLVLDWSAWGGIGMATRGSIPEIMKRAGIDMLEPQKTIPVVREEILSGRRGEAVVAGALGILLQSRDDQGGVLADGVELASGQDGASFSLKLLRAAPYEGLVLQTVLDPRQPYLDDHRIDGTPVFPGVMGVELFAQTVGALRPDLRVVAVRNVRFAAPLKCYRDEPRTADVTVRLVEDRHGLWAHCVLSSVAPVKAGVPAERKEHFAATLQLDRHGKQAPEHALVQEHPDGGRVDRKALYRAYFHTNSFQVLGETAVGNDGVSMLGKLAQPLPALSKSPSRWLTAPRLLELCFQTAGVIEIGSTRKLGLPASIDELVVFDGADDAGERTAQVQVSEKQNGLCFQADVVDASGKLVMAMRGYRTSALPTGLDDEVWAPLQQGLRGLET